MACIDWVTLGLLVLGGMLLLALLMAMELVVRLASGIWRRFITQIVKNPRWAATRPPWTRGDRLVIESAVVDDLAASKFLRELGEATTSKAYDPELSAVESVEVCQTTALCETIARAA